jgi:glycosyltransferase involved in cell wall biosynthesis
VANEQLRLALRSCLDQTFADFEVVLVLNGDTTFDVENAVRRWHGDDRRLRVVSTEVRHLTFSLALGLHCARGELVARMDSDDLSSRDRLERQVAFMRAHPEVVVLGTDYELIDEAGRPVRRVSMPATDSKIRRAMLRGNPLCHPSVMFRRAAVLSAGGYLGGIYAQDYDLWTRLAVDPLNRFANLPQVCLGYRMQGVGSARKARWAYASMAASQYRNFVLGRGFAWGIAAMLSLLKAILRSSPERRA